MDGLPQKLDWLLPLLHNNRQTEKLWSPFSIQKNNNNNNYYYYYKLLLLAAPCYVLQSWALSHLNLGRYGKYLKFDLPSHQSIDPSCIHTMLMVLFSLKPPTRDYNVIFTLYSNCSRLMSIRRLDCYFFFGLLYVIAIKTTRQDCDSGSRIERCAHVKYATFK